MRTTLVHLLAFWGWLYGFGAFLLFTVEWGIMPAMLGGVAFIAGFAGIFASWICEDAPTHAISRRAGFRFAYASLLIPILPVFPYLFFSRGIKGGFFSTIVLLLFLIPILLGAVYIFLENLL